MKQMRSSQTVRDGEESMAGLVFLPLIRLWIDCEDLNRSAYLEGKTFNHGDVTEILGQAVLSALSLIWPCSPIFCPEWIIFIFFHWRTPKEVNKIKVEWCICSSKLFEVKKRTIISCWDICTVLLFLLYE